MSRKSAGRRLSRAGPPGHAPRQRNEVRIIAGEWRGRRVQFAPVSALRPTPDRVRETLFNWLQPVIRGSRCLDLFAGSGALGIEALSRGATSAVFVESDRAVVHELRAALEMLGARGGTVQQQDARKFLAGTPQPFDIVFLDPPFTSDLLPAVCSTLEDRGWLAPTASIYLEMPARMTPAALPSSWTLARSKRAGEVGYHLARREDTATALQDRS